MSKQNSNQITVDQMIAKLDELVVARTAWENGTLKASNDEFAELLKRCVLLYRELSPSTQLKAKLADALKTRQVKVNRNANLATRVVRWVFGDNDQQYVYAKVIKVAAAEMPEAQSMAEWLLRQGGLTQVASRDKNGDDKKQRRQTQIELGRSYLDTAPALAALPSDIVSLQASSDAFGNYAIALVRRSSAGSLELVYGNNNASLVDALLLIAGKEALAKQNADNAIGTAVAKAANVAEVVEAISRELAA
jgi:hypothetical protein